MGRHADDWENAYGPDLSANDIAALGLDAAAVARIDSSLMEEAVSHWRKAARVVSEAMLRHQVKEECWFLFYAVRLRALVAQGRLEAQGDLYRMRFSEVRRPAER